MSNVIGNLDSLSQVVPELILAASAIVLFVLAAASRKLPSWNHWLLPGLTLVGLGGALCLLLITALGQETGLFDGSPTGEGLFGGMLAADPLAAFFRMLCLLATSIGVILSLGKSSLPGDRKGEYHGLLLVFCLGLCLLSGSNHLLMIYVSMESVSLCSYLLTGWDSSRRRSREAGLKYVLYGGVASGVMLFGMSLFYGLFGHLSLQDLNGALTNTALLQTSTGQWAALLSIVLILGGLGFKVALVPFHMWCPDAYEGAPTPFTALLSVGPKLAGFAVFIRFFLGLFVGVYDPNSIESHQFSLTASSEMVPWLLILGILSAVTMTLGNLSAIVQNNVKRLLAYSSIAHAGYILMGIVACNRQGVEAVTLYLGVYLLMNMGAFAVVSAVERTLGSEELEVYRGLGKRAPLLGLTMAVFLFSLTGLPPTAGFVGKLYLFAALIHNGGSWFILLAVVGVLNSVISLYYYARILKVMYLEKTEESHPVPVGNIAAVVACALAVPTLLLGLFWSPLAEIARWSSSFLR